MYFFLSYLIWLKIKMYKKISILGCGWLSKSLAFYLADKGFTVKGSNTSNKNKKEFEQNNIEPYLIDISKEKVNYSDFLSSEILIISITNKNISNFKRLVSAIENSPVKKVIFISSTSVYENLNTIVFENSKRNNLKLSKIEDIFKNSKLETTIIRFGGLFGYDRNPVNFIPKTKKMQQPNGYVNLIHRDDCELVIEKIIENNLWNEVFNACSGFHPKRKEFYTKLAKKYNEKPPIFEVNAKESYKIVSNKKLLKKILCNLKYDMLEF